MFSKMIKLHRVSTVRNYRVLHRRIDGGRVTDITSRHTRPWSITSRRMIIGTVAKSMTRLLKLRYLLLGGTVTGGVAAGKVIKCKPT